MNERNIKNNNKYAKKIGLRRMIASFLLLPLLSISAYLYSQYAHAAITKEISYQGKLTNAAGVSVADGNYSMVISLYTAASGGTPVWTARGTVGSPTARTVTVTNGIFSIMLGDTAAGDNAIALDFNSTYYLGIKVGSDTEMTPRKKVGASGYAFNADMLDGLDSATSGANAHIVATDASGNLTVSGDVNVNGGDINSTTTLTLNPTGNLNFQSASYYVNESGQMVLNTNETINGIDINAGAISDVTTFSSTYLATGASYVDIIGSAELRMGGTSVLTSARALQNITSATIDNIYIDGTTIGHTSDTDLLNLASNVLTVNGTLDLNGPIDLDVSVNDYAANFYNSNTGAAAGGLYIRTDGAGNLLTLNASGTDVMTISSTQASFNVPTAFTASGDVSMAYDLIFTNQTASNIKTNAPFTIEVGELFESNDLTLRTFNNGDVVLDAAGGVTLMQAQPWMLASGTSALNFQNSSGTSILNIDSTNNRVGIGTTTPSKALHLYSAAASEAILIESDYISAWLELDRASSGTNAAINLKTAGVERFNFGLANDSTENFYIGNSGFATKYFTINTSGNIGLGTTSPAEILDVNGRMRLAQTTAPATTTDKLYNVTGNLYWNGVNLTGGGSLPSGTSGQTLRHNGSGWVANSLLYNNGTNVGIGTTSPGSKLHVFGGAIYQSSVAGAAGYMNTNYSQLASTTNRNPGILVFGGSAGSEYGMDLGYNGAYRTRIFTSGSQDIAFAKLNSPATSQTDFVELMTIKNSGNVGIGTTSPGYLLTLADNNGIGIGAIRVISKDTGTGGAIHIGTGGSGFTGALNFDSNGGNKWAVSNAGNTTQSGTLTVSGTGNSSIAGNVGIGTTSPVEKLHVAGSTYTYLNITSDDTGHTSSDGMTIGLTASTASPANVGLVSVRENWPMVFMTNGSENMRISNTGNVGIGTNNPGAKLNVNGGTTGRYTALRLSHAGGLVNDDISLELWPASSYVTAPAKIIGTAVGGDAAGLEFNVSNLGVLNSAMVIDKLGNVGIGTTSPVARLQSSGAAQVNSPTLGSANGGGLYVTNTDFAYGLLAGVATSGNVWLQAQRTDSTATAYNILLQPSGGNVGIGTSNPGARLDVVGGAIRTNNQLISTIATGTAPLAVTSTTLNTNLNADLLDGQHGSYYATTASISGTDNYIPRFNGTSALENSNIYDNGTNIGIGTTTVPALLTVGSTGQFRVTSAGAVTATTYNGLGLTSAADGFTISGGTTSRTLSVTGGNFTVNGGGNTLTMTGNSSLNQNLLTTSAPTFAGLTLNGNLDLNGAIDLDVSVNDYAANFYNSNTGAAAGGLYIRTDGTGNLLTLNASGTDVVTISPTQASFNVPTSFTASGDVSMAYDLIFTNQTSSNIKTSSAFTIEVGEIFESNDLTLRTLNSGHVVLDAAGGVRLSQAQTWDLAAGTSALNFQNQSGTSILNIDSTNGRVGIGTMTPTTGLEIAQNADDSGLKINGYDDQSGKWVKINLDASGFGAFDASNGFRFRNNGNNIAYIDNTSDNGFRIYDNVALSFGTAAGTRYSMGIDTNTNNLNIAYGGSFIGTTYTKFTLTSTGYVGIGTTSPSEALDVNGRMRLAQTTAPATTTDKLYNVTGNLYWNGVNLTGGGSLPSGTSGQTLRNNGSGWVADSLLYNNGTNVGIGTTSPSAKLHVAQSTLAGTYIDTYAGQGILIDGTEGRMQVRGADSGTYGVGLIMSTGARSWYMHGTPPSSAAAGRLDIGTRLSAANESILENGSVAMSVLTNGNVGIGTTNPSSKLHVFQNASRQMDFLSGLLNVGDLANIGYTAQMNVKIAATGDNVLSLQGVAGQTGDFLQVSGPTATSAFFIKSTGNVGIGTTTPDFKLAVNGALRSSTFVVGSGSAAGYYALNTYGTGPQIRFFDTAGSYGTLGYGRLSVGSSYGAIAAPTSGAIIEGNVGIGTTNPTYPLHIYKTGANSTLAIQTTETAGTSNEAQFDLKSGDDYTRFFSRDSDNNFGIYHCIGGSCFTKFRLDGSGNMRLMESGGNVGIGTTSPVNKLHIAGSDGGVVYQKFSNLDTGHLSGDGFDIGVNASEQAIIWNRENTGMMFGTNDATRMFIDNTGNVGIGITVPKNALEVFGKAQAINFIAASGGIGSYQNLLSWSEDFSNAAWIGYFVKPSITTGISDPFGGTNATRFASADNGPYYSGVNQSGTLTAGTTYTASVWMRAVSGTLNVTFGFSDSYSTSATIDTTWRKYTYTAAPSADQNRKFQVYEGTSGNTAWEIAFPQTEASLTPGVYAKTEGSVISTRLAGLVSGSLYTNAATGNVGIGTASQTASLDIQRSAGVGSYFNIGNGAGTNVFNVGQWGNLTTGRDLTITPGGYATAADVRLTVNSASGQTGHMLDINSYGGSGGNLLSVSASGNVGIGTTSPVEILDVNGRMRLAQTTAPGTVTDKLYNVTGNLYWNGVNLTGGGALPSGTSGQTLRHNGTSWIANSVLYNNGTNIGIGTTSPGARLHVYESTGLGGTLGNSQIISTFAGFSGTLNVIKHNEWLYRDAAGTDWLTARLHDGISVDASFLTPGTNTKTWWERDPQHNIQSWGDAASTYLTINAGNVGIGTTNPTKKLQVTDTYNVYVGGSGLGTGANIYADNSMYLGTITANSLNIETADVTRLSIGGTGDFSFNSGQAFLQQSTGNFGIGTTTPGAKLEIVDSKTHVSGDLAGTDALLRLYNNYGVDVAEKGAVITFEDNYLGTTRTTRAAIKGGTATSGNTADGFLAFYTDASGANSMQERMRINYNGNVGIGTTNPGTRLDVVGGAIRTNNQLISTIATGTAPLAVTSTTLNTNLNADLLDGHDTSYFQTALTNPVTGTGTNGYNAYWTGTNTIGAEQYTAVTRGGTGVGTFTTGGILYGNGTSAIQATAVMTNGQLLIGDGTGAPTLATLTQGNAITVTNGAGSISIGVTNDSIGDTQLAFNTGQHLTTTSSPTFAGLTINGSITASGGLVNSPINGIGENVWRYSSFESSLANMTPYHSVNSNSSVSTDRHLAGLQSLTQPLTTSTTTGYYGHDYVAGDSGAYELKPNTTYTFSAWAYITGDAAADAMLQLENTYTNVDITNRSTTVHDQWVQLWRTFTTPAAGSTTRALLYAHLNTGTTNATIYWDKVMMVEGDMRTKWYADNNEVYGKLNVVGDIYGSLDLVVDGGDIANSGVGIDIGEAYTTGALFSQINDNAYFDIYCADSGGNDLCEFKTGIFNNGGTFYSQNQIIARGGIMNDTASTALSLNDADGVIFAGPISGITTASLSGQITSTLATGTAPFAVTSTTLNTNLNADLLDGQHGTYYATAASISGTDNYIPRFNGTSALENSNIYDNGTNIGIGTTTPGAKLDVRGGISAGTSGTQFVVSTAGLITAGTWNATSISDAYIDNNITISGGTIGSNNISGTLTTTGALTIGDNGDNIVLSGANVDIYSNGSATFGTTSSASNTIITALSSDSYNAGFEAYGLGQGTGYFYAGQSTTHGGGIFYSGDGTPAFATGEGNDRISFYRRNASVNEVAFSYAYSSNDVTFRGNVFSELGISTYDTTVADNTIETGQLCLGNGTNCITSWTNAGGNVDGSGTLNYLSKWTPDGNTIGNSIIYDNGTNIGIGTTSPGEKLEIGGGNLRVWNDNELGGELTSWVNNPSHPYETFTTSGTDITSAINTTLYGMTYTQINAVAGELYKVTFNMTLNSGAMPTFRVGPSSTLTVYALSKTITSGSNTFYFYAAATGNMYVGLYTASGAATDYSVSGYSLQKVTGGNVIASGQFTGGGVSGLKIDASGNVGIGTTTPGALLDVVGGAVRTNNQLISTIATGTAPLSVASTTVVTNLNADMVDGYHLNQNVLTSSSPTFAGLTLNGNLALGGNTITTSNTGLISNLNADLLDGQHGSYYDQRVYSSATNYLGGGYVSGGLEKPNWAGFGAGKLKLQMLSGTNIGGGGTWNDVLWLSSYTGSDVKGSYALVFNKYADEVGFIRQAYDATDWGTYQKLWHTGNDGSGSTLDADLLDGHDTSYFQTALTNPVTGTGTNGYNAYWTGTNTIGAEQYTAVSRGGTGVGTLTTGGILYGNGTSAIQATAVMTNGQLLIGDGTGAPTLATLTQGNAITVTNGAGSISIGVTNDSISDTQLAFNTGQHLTTTSSPTFAGLTLNGNLVLGSNTITTTNTNVITNLNADLLDGYHGGSYVHIGAYNNTNGYLIATDIAAASDTMFEMDIIGNSYGSLQPIHITIQGYNYNTGNAIINTAGLAEDWTRSVSVFNYNGYLYFWLDQSSSYQSIAAYVRRTQDSSPRNRVTGITNEVKPTTGVTREVAITPKQAWNSGNDGSGSTLDADLLDGHDTSYFQTALTNPVTGTGTNGYNAYWTGTNTIGAEQYTAVSRGGTGVGTLTTGGILYGNGTSAIQATAVMTNGQLLIGDGSGVPTLATLTQGSNIAITNGAGSITIATSATPSFTTINGLTLAAAADGFTISGGTTSRTLTITGSDVAINQNLQTTNSPTFARTYVSGLSTSWGSTNGVNTGGVNVTMGTSSSATWLISGTSGGTFRAGIQALDSNGQLRIYSNSSYLTISGNTISMSGQLTSTLATGTAPLAVTSTTLNTNLNADLLDGQHGAYYATAASISGTDNYIPRFNGTSALENSIMYDTGTNVGIGTTSPGAKLEVSTGALGTSLNDVVEMQRISGSSSNASYIDFRHIRTSAGSDWSTAGLRVQSKVDATWLGYMQFNGNANGGGISFGTGTTTTAPGNVSESMRIDGVGRVGIGTTGPGSKLDVRGGGGGTVDLYVSGRIKTGDGNNNGGVWLDAASTQFVGQYSANTLGIYNNNNWGLVVNNSGSVGMGTTSPGAKLDIQGGSLRVGSAAIASANAGDISISREGDPTSGYMYFGNAGTNYFGYNGSGYTFNAKSTINGSTGAINVGSGISNSTVVIAGTNTYDTAVSGYKQIGALYSSNTMGADVGAGLTLGGIYTGTSKTDFAQIAGIKENATDGNYSGALTLYTRQNGNVALQERMRIDSAGLVGIGTTTPVEALDINGRLRLAQTTAPADTTNKLYNVSGNLYWNGINLSGGAMPSGTTGQTLRHDGTNWVANSVLYNNGTNIGIGSTSPSAKLDVLSSTTPQFSLGYDASNKMSVSVASSGTVTFATKTMSDTYAGYNNPSSASSSYWSNPTYVYSSDDTYASQYAVGSSGAIQATNFGFSIPTNAIIKGVQVVVEGHATLNGVQESNVQLVVGGVAQGSDRSVASVWGLSDVAYTSGGTEDTWGLSTLTPAVVNASNFGATVTLNSTSAAFEYIDSIRIRVYYSTNYAPFAFTNYVGIGTTAPTEKLQVVGGVRFSNFGAGTLQTDANGVLTVSSDENLKNIDSSFDRGLEAIMNINPISYHWKGSSGLDTMNEYTGFSAQNVKKSIPEAIGVDSRGFLTLTDRPILAAAVNAIKQQQGQLKDLNLKTDANVSSIMGLKESVDQQLTSVSLKFASQDEAISTVNQKIADMDLLLNFMKTSLDDQKVIVDKINEQMELIKSQNEAILDFAIALDAEKLIYKDEAGNIDLLNGKVTATEMVAGVFTVKITDPEARTIGEAIIRSGSSNVEIKTRAVTDNSKIFVTAKVASEYPLAVTQKKSGEGFVVSVKGNVTEDVSFDWWIVESKDDTENVTRAVPVTQASVSFEGPIDSDGDGLVDEEELRIGTNQYSYDTDGDGFLDGDELRFGYNPLVASDGNKGDKIIFDDPKVAGVIDDSYVIINSAFSDNGAGWYKLDSNGTVPANRPVTVFVYGPEGLNSTVGTIADAEGNWNITVNKDFADGAYEIYVVQTNIDGSITSKSGAFITSK